jgi:hypothetical protein
MPKIAGKVLAVAIVNGKMLMKAQLNGRLPKVGDNILVKFGKVRSNSQNALYWLYLQFLWSDCDLRSEYNTVEDLHEAMKATFLSKRVFHGGLEFIHVKSTTELDKLTFGEYIKQIDNAMVEYEHCNTAPFWQEYKDNKDGISKDMLELSDEGKAAQARGEF